MQRTRWIGTSWKMNKTLTEAAVFIDIVAAAAPPPGIQVFVLPAHTALATVRDRLPAGSSIMLGAQNAHWRPEGAGTGEVSMRMVADAGARLVEMGHSERRAEFGETDASVAAKAVAAIEHGLIPLICVGEPEPVRKAGGADDFVAAQVQAALSDLDAEDVGRVLIAYEPIWAIGAHGRPAHPEEIAPVLQTIARTVAARRTAGLRALLYGGGVAPANAAEILRDPHVDGLFVGRAGWQPEGFLQLIALLASAGTAEA